MKETEGVAEYITRVETVANQLSRNGETLPASRVVEKILWSLMDDFENMVCAIEESKDLSMLTVEEVVGSLEEHEQRKKKKVEPLDQLLQTKMSIKDEKAQNTQGRGRYRGGIRSGPSGRSRGQEEKEQSGKKKIGTKEDEVHGEEVNQETQMLSALSVASMAIMQRTVTQASLSVVVSPNILPKIVNLKVERKRRSTSQKMLKKKRYC